MFIKLSKIILSTKVTLMLILTISIFFSKKKWMKFMKSKKFKFNLTGSSYKFWMVKKKKKNMYMFMLKNMAILSLIPLFLNIISNFPKIVFSLNPWFFKKKFSVKLEFHFDFVFKMFFSVALFVSWSIIEFSFYYTHKEPKPNKFFRLLMIFLLNMIILVSSNNLFMIFIGWEGVGFLSFLLISWWSSRNKANKAAIQAIMYKRMGDMGLLLFFAINITLFNSWSLSEIFLMEKDSHKYFLKMLLISVLLAATGKSAQFGLHPWLPAAMEGPTPVSALLHSSTMVVAGIFLLIRVSFFYKKLPKFNKWCLILGSMTALFAATSAISQHDMKKIMAYSTTSQLGLMMIAMGMKQPKIALFHMCTHAFFKAMLFLSSGSIIHSLNDEQDLRKMGGLFFLLPNTSACMFLGSLALSGIPFLAGFYSKDLILEISLISLSKLFSIILAIMATFLTSVYSLRIFYYCFFKTPCFSPLTLMKEENKNLSKALNRLALNTMMMGWFFSFFIFEQKKFSIKMILKKIIFFASVSGFMLTFYFLIYFNKKNNFYNFLDLNSFFSNQWFYEKMFHSFFLSYSFSMSLLLSSRKIDQGWNENLSAQGISKMNYISTQAYQQFQSGYMKQYLLSSVFIFFFILLFMLFLNIFV